MQRKPFDDIEKIKRWVDVARSKTQRTGIEEFIPATSPLGFGVRIKPGGSATWIFYRTLPQGRIRRSIGAFDSMTLDAALQSVHRLLENPRAYLQESQQDAMRTVRTVDDLWTAFTTWDESATWRRLAQITQRTYKNLYAGSIKPDLGDCLLGELSHREVAAWHARMSATPSGGNRSLATLSAMCKFAVNMGFLPAPNPCHDIGRHPENPRVVEVHTDEWPFFGHALHHARQRIVHKPATDFLLCVLLTGAREAELMDATRPDFMETREFCRINVVESSPSADPRRIYLGKYSRAIVKAAIASPGTSTSRIFQQAQGSGRVTIDTTMEAWWESLAAQGHHQPHVRVHDLRHVWRSQATHLQIRMEVAETLMGHKISGNMARLYGRPQPATLQAAADQVEERLWNLIFPDGCPWAADYGIV